MDDSPYYALTDRDGRFSFDGVPAGPVEVVAWHPSSAVVRQERDPESGFITRQTYGPPVEAVRRATVEPGRTAAAFSTP